MAYRRVIAAGSGTLEMNASFRPPDLQSGWQTTSWLIRSRDVLLDESVLNGKESQRKEKGP